MKISFLSLFWETFTKWQKHDATLRAAALTFFTIMPLPSLALIAVAVLAQVYGQEAALVQFTSQISSFAGPSVANLLSEILVNAQSPLTSIFGSLLAIVFAVSGALGAFSVLQKSMDTIWEVKGSLSGKRAFIKEKVVPFALIIAFGLIVVAWTAVSTVLFNVMVYALSPVLGGFAPIFLRILEIVLSLGLGTVLFALIFKLLPETEIQWRDVWLTAFITGIVFTGLNYMFGLYLSLFQVTTLAGTAGSLIVLFLWIYLTNLFILFGAQLSKVYTERYGSHLGKHRPVLKKRAPQLQQQMQEVESVEMSAEINVKATPEKTDEEKSSKA